MTNGLTFEGVLMEQLINQVEPHREESCGFLIGREYGKERTVTGFIPAINAATTDRERQFIITPTEYLRAEETAVWQGLLLLGIYHSHPDHPAIPSERDRVAAQPYFSYLIVSLMGQRFNGVRSWRLNHVDQFVEEYINKK
jgi:proteasome lid subunit RPN8/RPN11